MRSGARESFSAPNAWGAARPSRRAQPRGPADQISLAGLGGEACRGVRRVRVVGKGTLRRSRHGGNDAQAWPDGRPLRPRTRAAPAHSWSPWTWGARELKHSSPPPLPCTPGVAASLAEGEPLPQSRAGKGGVDSTPVESRRERIAFCRCSWTVSGNLPQGTRSRKLNSALPTPGPGKLRGRGPGRANGFAPGRAAAASRRRLAASGRHVSVCVFRCCDCYYCCVSSLVVFYV